MLKLIKSYEDSLYLSTQDYYREIRKGPSEQDLEDLFRRENAVFIDCNKGGDQNAMRREERKEEKKQKR